MCLDSFLDSDDESNSSDAITQHAQKEKLLPMGKTYKDDELIRFCDALEFNLLFDLKFQNEKYPVYCPCEEASSKWRKTFNINCPVICSAKISSWANLREHCHKNDDLFHRSISVFLQVLYPRKYRPTRKKTKTTSGV